MRRTGTPPQATNNLSWGRGAEKEAKLPVSRPIDVSSLRTALSGECIDVAPASAVRCTISVRRKELGSIVLHAHVVNDTEEAVRCAPGSRSDSTAFLQTELNAVCEPHAELGFLFRIARFGRRRSAFVRVSGTTFACGFETAIEEDATRTILASVGIAALFVGVITCVVLYERKRRAEASKRFPEPPPVPRTEPAANIVPVTAPAPPPAAAPAPVPAIATPATHGLQARGFAALLDENRAVMAALECTHRRLSSSEFIAKFVNQASERLHCTIGGRTRRGTVRLEPYGFWIHPQSAAEVNVTVPLRVPWRVRSLDLRMESTSVNASARADVPTPPIVQIAFGVAIAVLIAAVCAAAYYLARPRIVAFALPSTVLAGTSVTASYSIAGTGTARYDVSEDGIRIASGTMPSGRGSVTFPTAPGTGTYRVTISLQGVFGAAQATHEVAAVARLTPQIASIGTLAVDPGVAAAGAPVRVRYAAAADTGTVSLVDVTGIALQSVPYRAQGISMLAAPPVEAPTQYQVRLDVSRGSSRASASVGLLVLPQPLATPTVAHAPAQMLTAGTLLRVVPARVVSSRPFIVDVLSHPANLRLELENARGIPVAILNVAPQASRTRFRAPYVTSDQTFTIVASFTRGSADQVVLDPIVIHAR